MSFHKAASFAAFDNEAEAVAAQAERPFTIIVEGNIGSGKSTFLLQFEKALEAERKASWKDEHQRKQLTVEIFSEPVDKWRDANGHNLLQLMYSDPCRWALAFQSYVQLTMTQLHLRKTDCSIKMMERSLYSGRHCFIENLHRSGKLPGSEYNVLVEWFRFLTSDLARKKKKFDVGVDLIVYLRTNPEVAWERVKRRARSEEKVIPLDYLRELHVLHEDWLMKKENLPAPVLVIDADGDLNSTPDLFSRHQGEILEAYWQKFQKLQTRATPKRILGEVN